MIVNRKYGTYKVIRCFVLTCHVRGMYVLSEQGRDDWWGSSQDIAAEIDRREKQKETDWNQFQGTVGVFISRSRR